VNVFIPCAPPTTGFLVMAPRHEVKVLNITVEDGLKMVMSGGIVVPPDRRPTAAAPTPATVSPTATS
jgi:uncharacterized membrane protein